MALLHATASGGAPPPGFIPDTSEKVGWRKGDHVIVGTLTADGKFQADPAAAPVSVVSEVDGRRYDLLDRPVYPRGAPPRVVNWPEYGEHVWELRGDLLVAGRLADIRTRGENEFFNVVVPGKLDQPRLTLPFADYDPRTADLPIYNLPGRFEGYRRYTVPRHLRGARLVLTVNRRTICVNDPLLVTIRRMSHRQLRLVRWLSS